MSVVSKRLRDAMSQLRYLPRAFRLIMEAAGTWALVWAALLAVQGILPAISVYLTKPLVDSVEAVIGAGVDSPALQPLLVYAALMALVIVGGEALGHIVGGIRTRNALLIQDHVSTLIHHSSLEADLGFYENAEFHDQLYRARDQASTSSQALMDGVGSILQSGVSMLGIAVVLIPYGWWVPILLFLASLPAVTALLRHQWRYHDWWRRTTPDRRWGQYYSWIITWADAAPEARIFRWGLPFHERFSAIRKGLRDSEMRLVRDQILARLAAGGIGLLIFGAVMGWMVWRAVQGNARLGDLALFYQAFNRGQTQMNAFLASGSRLFTNVLFLGNLFAFLDLRPAVEDPPSPRPTPKRLREGIRFDNVRFSYPNTDRLALDGFNLFIPAGRTIAIVGNNGAGKSTLIKLLCRFYDVDDGAVTIDGIDVRDLSQADLRNLLTVMFQTPVPYHATVAENIAIGSPMDTLDHSRVVTAAQAAGAHEIIESLPQGYETLLGKWFVDGTELSGGERQRMALARAFFRDAQIIVLDEPTSFMDSWAEAEWLDRFRELVAGRTAIIVTHRFTTAMRADYIHVMKAGQIVESGSHEELLAIDGAYAQSWRAQMEAARPRSSRVTE